jgi:Family of unknown function (DUF6308)
MDDRRYDAKYRRPDLNVTHLTRIVADDQACQDLRCYFGIGLDDGKLPPSTGGRFEFLDGGGDRAGICCRFTAADIVAVKLLSIDVPGPVALDLIEGALGDEAATFLGQIPASVKLWDPEAEGMIEKGGPADSLWRLLERQDGVGWVTAGKLLARKRPALIPVYDNVVRCAFGRPRHVWTALRNALRQDDGTFRAALEDVRQRAGLPCQVTPLRVLDVAIWMRHRSLHTGYRCSGLT